jgi:hypothetical protein
MKLVTSTKEETLVAVGEVETVVKDGETSPITTHQDNKTTKRKKM